MKKMYYITLSKDSVPFVTMLDPYKSRIAASIKSGVYCRGTNGRITATITHKTI